MSKSSNIVQQENIEQALIAAVTAKNVNLVKKYVQLGAQNLDEALQQAQILNEIEITNILEQAIEHRKHMVILTQAELALGTGIVLFQAASFLYDTYFKETEEQQLFTRFATFSDWENAVKKLPKNREGADYKKDSGFASCGSKNLQWQEFNSVLDQWLLMKSQGVLSDSTQWVESNQDISKPQQEFFDIKNNKIPFTPFVQKLMVNPDDTIFIRGDLHGDIASLMEQLKKLKDDGIMDDNFKLKKGYKVLTLGDYVDRGQYGVEVIYTLMRLSLANPEQVILVRGNHEESDFNARYEFQKEVDAKFGDSDHAKHLRIGRMYDFLPIAVYMGCKDKQSEITNYLQCCHGALEIGYQPQKLLDTDQKNFQLLGFLNRNKACCCLMNNKDIIQKIKNDICLFSDGSIEDDIVLTQLKRMKKGDVDVRNGNVFSKDRLGLGFVWGDFSVDNTIQFRTSNHAGFEYGQEMTEAILQQQSSLKSQVRGVLRGHQHSCDKNDPMMKGLIASLGVFNLWQKDENGNDLYETDVIRSLKKGKVWTFNVAPDSVYGQEIGFDFDTIAKIKLQEKYEDWKMEVINP